MSINVISTNNRNRVATAAGTTREIITANDGAKDLRASIHEVEPNRWLQQPGQREHLGLPVKRVQPRQRAENCILLRLQDRLLR